MADDALREFASIEGAADKPAHPPVPASTPKPAPERRPNLYERRRAAIQRRFGAAYFALAVATGIAIGLVVVLVGRSSATHQAWSAFKPSSVGLEGAQQIASRIAPRYRLGRQELASALAAAPILQQTTIAAAAVRTGFQSERASDVKFYRTDHAVLYQLTGANQNATIPGTPTFARANLLKREILELSLYSFKYLNGIDTVIALGPPALASDGKNVIPRAALVRRDDFRPQLSVPLVQTLPYHRTETVSLRRTRRELQAIGKIRFMEASSQQLPSGDALLVLTPVG